MKFTEETGVGGFVCLGEDLCVCVCVCDLREWVSMSEG